MTQAEIDKQYNQVQQDNTALNYSKWSAQQRQANLSTDHGLWQQERDRVLARQQRDNEAAKQRHINNLKAERQAKAEAELERQLEPQKQALMRDWLANNPTFTEADFNQKAWIHLKQNLIEKREAVLMDAEMKSQMATGRYSL